MNEGTLLRVLDSWNAETRWTTRGRESFNGAALVAVGRQDYGRHRPADFWSTDYFDLVDDTLLHYGSTFTVGGGITTGSHVLTPPLATPIAMQPGHVVVSRYVQRTSLSDGTIQEDLHFTITLTYVGQEIVQAPLGSYAACHFIETTGTTHSDGSPASEPYTIESWRAAEGPYRGQVLKRHYPASAMDQVVVEMTYAPK